MTSITPSVFCRTSLFQKRRTRKPSRSKKAVPITSVVLSACCPPSTSMTRRDSKQTKSATYLSIGTWLRNRCPLSCFRRSRDQSFVSASVGLPRSWRATLRAMISAGSIPPPQPPPSPTLPRKGGGRFNRCCPMPKRTDLESILIIGAGPIIIGQACEFDYSGTQACKALRAEGYRIILVNSNPATIMTDPGLADATYVEPITPEILTKIIAKETPSTLLPTMGGQTALNAAMKLADLGVLAEHGVELIGASRDAIAKAEDRLLFRDAMTKIGLECPKSMLVTSLADANQALDLAARPPTVLPSFPLPRPAR